MLSESLLGEGIGEYAENGNDDSVESFTGGDKNPQGEDSG